MTKSCKFKKIILENLMILRIIRFLSHSPAVYFFLSSPPILNIIIEIALLFISLFQQLIGKKKEINKEKKSLLLVSLSIPKYWCDKLFPLENNYVKSIISSFFYFIIFIHSPTPTNSENPFGNIKNNFQAAKLKALVLCLVCLICYTAFDTVTTLFILNVFIIVAAETLLLFSGILRILFIGFWNVIRKAMKILNN